MVDQENTELGLAAATPT